jgi:hypothetical protein
MDWGDVTWSPRRLRFLGRRGDLGMTRVHGELCYVCDVLGRAEGLPSDETNLIAILRSQLAAGAASR